MTHEEFHKLPFRVVSHISIVKEHLAAYPYVTNSILAKVIGKSVNKVHRRGVILGLVKEIGGKSSIKYYYRALLYKNIEDMYDALTRDEQMEMCIALINRLTYGNKTRT